MQEIRFIEMFCGIGGFRKGLEQASKKFRCVWANDNDKYASKIYKKNFGSKELLEGNIRTINSKSIPNHDLLTAGFPCQSFSIAGKRKGFKETRGTLFFEICRIIIAKRPTLLLLENVKGLLNHNKGKTFTIILQTLDELRYDVEWCCLNSKHFGVPQNRERVFIIGHPRERSTREIFPLSNNGKTVIKNRAVVRTLHGGGHSGGLHSNTTMIKIGNIATSGHDSLWGRVYDPRGISPNLNAKGGGLGAKTGLIQVQPKIIDTRSDPEKKIRVYTKTYPTIGTTFYKEPYNVSQKNMRIRRLTPIECERLQGFPDGFTEGVSNTQRYKSIGNAVTVNVIQYLGKQILSKIFN